MSKKKKDVEFIKSNISRLLYISFIMNDFLLDNILMFKYFNMLEEDKKNDKLC